MFLEEGAVRHIRNLLFSFVIGFSALLGGVRSDELEDLLSTMSTPKIAHTLPDENPDGEPIEDFRDFADFD
jgi:hypothetical protein